MLAFQCVGCNNAETRRAQLERITRAQEDIGRIGDKYRVFLQETLRERDGGQYALELIDIHLEIQRARMMASLLMIPESMSEQDIAKLEALTANLEKMVSDTMAKAEPRSSVGPMKVQ